MRLQYLAFDMIYDEVYNNDYIRNFGISTVQIGSLNPIMVDGTGMCGALSCYCRAMKLSSPCVDGPEFDGFKVNFDEAMRRQTIYKQQEVQNTVISFAAKPSKSLFLNL